jgi:ssRNA-specific RNase YbeY (16S rRNA maturation enzyme)
MPPPTHPPTHPPSHLVGTLLLSLVACDDARIARLNAQHRGKQGPTDVLSFEMEDELDFKVASPCIGVGVPFHAQLAE